MKLYLLIFLSFVLIVIGLVQDPLKISRAIYILLGIINVLILVNNRIESDKKE